MRKSFNLLAALAACAVSLNMAAQNPIVQTCFTTDPAPMVSGDRIYVYTGHDENNADFFWMQEWRVYSSADMVNWTDHGSPLALESFTWADDRAWASQTVERNGKFYWYICAHSKLSGGMAIGVAVSDSPTGPFKDAIGKPLYENGSWDHIDPTVLIDDDGQAWLIWGNPRVYCLKLNKDMISADGDPVITEPSVEGFGGMAARPNNRPNNGQNAQPARQRGSYTEGPWLMKHGKKYMLLYAAGGIPEHIAYSTSSKPNGPWTYAGIIMPQSDTGSFTNHCGVAEFKGHNYFFYHTGKLPHGGGYGRSVAVEEFKWNDDGTFPTIQPTAEGVKPIGTLNPYKRVEAETMAFSLGVTSEMNDETGVYVADIHNGDYIKLQSVDFGANGPKSFSVCAASALRGGQIEIHIDNQKGNMIGRIEIGHTGGWEKWQTVSTDLRETVTGVHDLYFVFKGRKGPKLFNLDYWQFK